MYEMVRLVKCDGLRKVPDESNRVGGDIRPFRTYGGEQGKQRVEG